MADDAASSRPRRPVAWWVLFTFVLLLTFQTAVPVYIVISQGLAPGFDWGGFIAASLGFIAIPMLLGCLGLVWRSRRGLGFCIVAVAVYFALEFARLTAAVGA
ncbi:hypothetical protein [Gymnodinialimonas ulvae]|uniref:hypothetical protein n=1 Tax=Gymnodinialimonas ulvae TaxID=3126504 RepID=UPI00309FEF39